MIKFRLPSLPSSMNQIYNINFGQRKIFLKPEVRRWKTNMKVLVPKPDFKDPGYIKLDATYCYNFFYKNGNVKKLDTQNMLKVLIDCVSEKIGIGDHLFKSGSWSSIHSENEEWVEVTLSSYQME